MHRDVSATKHLERSGQHPDYQIGFVNVIMIIFPPKLNS